MRALVKQLSDDDSGATAIEYALIASLISIVIVGILFAINGEMAEMYSYIGTNLAPALTGGE